MTDDKSIKKASELLIEMDQKLDNITLILKNQDNLLKILSNKLNIKENNIQRQDIQKSGYDNEFVQVKPNLDKNIAVQQRITYNGGKNISMAVVEITGGNLTSPKILKTNTMGKWITILQPGNYKIKITKKDSKTGNEINLNSSFILNEEQNSVELPVLSQ